MRRCLFILLLIAGCTTAPSIHYNPVDWDSNSPVNPPIVDVTPIEHPSDVPANIQTLLKLHNRQRELKGRQALTLDSTLMQYAQNHAEWMAKRNRLQHSDISQLMGKFHTAGENIAWNQQSEGEVVDAWMDSTGHRENILNRSFSKVGFGIAYNSNGEPYWCTCFGG